MRVYCLTFLVTRNLTSARSAHNVQVCRQKHKQHTIFGTSGLGPADYGRRDCPVTTRPTANNPSLAPLRFRSKVRKNNSAFRTRNLLEYEWCTIPRPTGFFERFVRTVVVRLFGLPSSVYFIIGLLDRFAVFLSVLRSSSVRQRGRSSAPFASRIGQNTFSPVIESDLRRRPDTSFFLGTVPTPNSTVLGEPVD